MANTLNVGATKDFTGDLFSPAITLIDFTNLFAAATATFAGSQFDGTNISKSVAIDGSIQGNNIVINNAAAIAFSAENWTFANWSAADTITINGSGGGDKLFGSSQKDAIKSGGGGDSVAGGAGNDNLDGGAGNDSIEGGAGADILNGGLDTDTLIYATSNLAVTVNLATTSASGGHADGDIFGNFENLTGSGFNDTLNGSTGVNAISGGNGDDTIAGLAAGDSLNGGAGTGDAVDYSASNAGVTVNLALNTASGGHADGDTISNFENAIGSAHGDTLLGTSGINVLSGLAGDDTIDGGAGADLLDGGSDTDTVKLDRSAAVAGLTVNISIGGGGADIGDGTKLSGFERLEFKGGTGADKVTGGGLGDIIDGGTGADNLNGGGGADLLILDRGASALAFDVNVSNGIERTLTDGVKYSNFEQIVFTGGGGGDVISGFDFDDVIKGGGGADDLSAGSGLDFLDGGEGDDFLLVTGSGADTVIGGIGSDFLFLDRLGTAAKLTVNISAGGGGADIGDGTTLDGIETLGFVGGTLRDVVTGGALSDSLDGQDGNDTLNGGGGNDHLAGNDGVDTLNGGGGNDNFDGGEGADTMNGASGGDSFFISSQTGADTIDGGGGIDFLFAGFKLDPDAISIDISTGAGVVSLTGATFKSIEKLSFIGGDGDDVVTGGGLDDELDGRSGGNTLNGGGGDDIISGGDLRDEGPADVQNFSGGDGDDAITANGAVGLLDGGAGDDRVTLNLFTANTASVLDGGAGTDSVTISGTELTVDIAVDLTKAGVNAIGAGLSLGNFEQATFLAGSGGDSFRGGALDDVFFGGDGDDLVIGSGGIDESIGGGGIDTLSYIHSAAGVQVALEGGPGAGGDAEGDNYFGFENLTGSEQADTLIGDNFANLIDGRGGNDTVSGLAGADTLTGGTGADKLTGGGGNDTLNGGANADTLIAGTGKDALAGGGGADKFVFNAIAEMGLNANRDAIADFTAGSDKIDAAAIDANASGGAPDDAFIFLAGEGTAFTGVAGEIRFEFAGGATIVSFDTNGDQAADGQVQLAGQIILTATDFVL